jgi:hypothetical protein
MVRSIFVLGWLGIAVLAATGADRSGGPRRGPGYTTVPSYDRAQSDYWAEWRSFKSNTEALEKTIGATNADAAQALAQIQTNALFLKTKWDAWFLKHTFDKFGQAGNYNASSDDYLRGLQNDNRLLSRLKKEKDASQALSVLRDVALDLQTKADNCRNSGDGLGKEIKVKVHTTAGGKEVGGFEVYYVQKGMFEVKSAHDRFPRQSSPTDEKILAPGGYAMWVRKGTVTTEPITLRIGGSGEKQLSVDLEVPSQ